MTRTRLAAVPLLLSITLYAHAARAQTVAVGGPADPPEDRVGAVHAGDPGPRARPAMPAPQMSNDDHWGFSFTYVPVWKAIDATAVLWDADQIDMEGSEFRVGFVRGSERGGHWGVSFVYQRIKDGSTISRDPFDEGGAALPGDFGVFEGASVQGVEWEGFTPFVTIKDRVQIGVAYGAGVGWIRGNVEGHEFRADLFFDPQTGMVTIENVTEAINDFPAKDLYELPVTPLGRFEAMVSVLVAPGLKLSASGGFNFPGTQIISFSVSYLIGG